MIVLSGAQLVLPDRVLSPGTLAIDRGRIAEIRSDAASGHLGTLQNHYIVP
jgi:alpha-D-ribose 1-methylphosphonate 5-triphosphate diphosphatase PhnM